MRARSAEYNRGTCEPTKNMLSAYGTGSMSSERTISLHGTVISRRGNAKAHISAEIDEFEAATNEKIIPGSLNVILSAPTLFSENTVRACSNGKRLLWPAKIRDKNVWIYRFPHAPLHVAEILSDEHLRSRFELKDGDQVHLEVSPDMRVPMSIRQWCAWQLIWRGRARWSYHNDLYYFRTRRLSINLGATQQTSKRRISGSLWSFLRNGLG